MLPQDLGRADFVDPDDLDAWRRAVRGNTKAFFGETIGNPAGTCSTSRRWPRSRTSTARRSSSTTRSRRRYLCRPHRVGRRHRRALGDEVHRRPRHRIGGVVVDSGRVRLVERALPGGRRPVAGLPRPRLPRDLRRVRVPDEAARRDAARPRGCAEPVQRVSVPAGDRDAEPAHGRGTSRTRSASRSSSRRTRSMDVRYPGLRTSPTSLAQKYLPRGAGAVFSFDLAGGREAGKRFIERSTLWSHLANVGDAQEPRHPSGEHDSPAALRRRAPGAGIGPGTIRLSVVSRISTTCSGISSKRASRARAQSDPWSAPRMTIRPRPLPGSAQIAAMLRRQHGRDRRTFPQRAARQPLRRLLPAAPRLSHRPGEPARDRDPRAASYPLALRDVPGHVDIVDVFRAARSRPAIAEEAVAIGAGALWLQYGVISRGGRRSRAAAVCGS